MRRFSENERYLRERRKLRESRERQMQDRDTVIRRTLAYIQAHKGAWSPGTIAAWLDCERSAVHTALCALVDRGEARRAGGGTYMATPKESQRKEAK